MYKFPQQPQKLMFILAKIFGKKIAKNLYIWRNKIWVTGELDTNERF